MKTRGAVWFIADAVLIFLLAAALVQPLFEAAYLDRWESIEGAFAANARFLSDHWPHPRWNPLWYCGTRSDYIYPPALQYGAAALVHFLRLEPVRAYHLYSAFFYCLGIAGVYGFIRVANGSRGAAWLGAAAAALVSPSFLFLREVRHGTPLHAPQRLGVLVRFGEGPHMSSLALIPIALAFTCVALRGRRFPALAAAAVSLALVVSHNFYGTFAIAILFPLLAWSIWVTQGGRRVPVRAAAIAALAYGLTAFWLTPSYVGLTVYNLRYVTDGGNAGSAAILAAAVAVYCAVSYRLARGRPERWYPVFLAGGVVVFAADVLGFFWFRLLALGVPVRFVPELDLMLILAGVGALRRLWTGGRRGRIAAAVVSALALCTALPYVSHAWALFRREPDYRSRVEYRISDWMWRNLPESRAMVTGSVRFWYDTWHDLALMGGGSDPGMINAMTLRAAYGVFMAPPASAVEWLEAMGVDAVVVHGPRSQEKYHDFKEPAKFAGLLPVLYDSGSDDLVYRVPRRYPARARVVDLKRMDALEGFGPVNGDAPLGPYVEAVERGPGAAVSMTWRGTDAIDLRARLEPGQGLLVQESYDPSWRAWTGGQRLRVRKDMMGFMIVEAPPGDQRIRMVFETPRENAAGMVLTIIAVLALAAGLIAGI